MLPLEEVPSSGEKFLRFSEVLQAVKRIGSSYATFDMILDAMLFESILGYQAPFLATTVSIENRVVDTQLEGRAASES
jgi:hypothetical protein